VWQETTVDTVCVPKNTTQLSLAITSTNVERFVYFWQKCWKESNIQTVLYFPPHLTGALHYLEKQKAENCVFSLKCWILLCQQTHKTHSYYHFVKAEPPFIRTRIDYMHQTQLSTAADRPARCSDSCPPCCTHVGGQCDKPVTKTVTSLPHWPST